MLNGAKMWITNGTVADLAIVWAKLQDEATGTDAIRGFLVEKGTKGFTAPEQKRKHSLRASVTSELILQDVFVPEDATCCRTASGLKGPLGCLTQARYGIAFGVVGAAMACFHAAAEYSKARIMFGKPIGRFQLVQDEARRHADRDHQGAAAVRPARAPQGARHGHARAGLARQAQQLRDRARHRARARATSSAPTASPPSTR